MRINRMPVHKIPVEENFLRNKLGESDIKPYIEVIDSCECGKYCSERYKGLTCNRCETMVIPRETIFAPRKMRKEEIIKALRKE